ncbi:hypothetical protein T492DRAFT_1053344 [Pavlovales sp. CCMP2436]|nr:hypothetical protein T492DRAFT_1053344 [Pavlovales sp. CCMP2436]
MLALIVRAAARGGVAGMAMPALPLRLALPPRCALATSSDAKHRTAEMRGRRQLRISSKIQRALAELLSASSIIRTSNTATDVMVTGITVSPDMKAATAYWMPDPRSRVPKERLQTLLQRQAVGLARTLANNVQLRSVPKLTFMHDEALAGGQRVVMLIDLLNLDRKRREVPQPAELEDGAVASDIRDRTAS